MTHKPILNIYQDGSEYFAAHPDFVDLQSSSVVWLKAGVISNLLCELSGEDAVIKLTDEEKTARFERARTDGAEEVDRFGRKNWATREDWGE